MDSRGPNEALIGVPGSRHALDTPALVLDIDVMEANIASMAAHARAHDYQLRPVAKIHKSVDVARLQVAAGANGVTCATLAECEAMTDGGVPGCLLFTSVVSAPKLARLAALNARAEDLIVVADNPANLLQLAEAGRQSGRPLQVLVDIEVGGRRTGIAGDERGPGVREARGGDRRVAVRGRSGVRRAITRTPSTTTRGARDPASCSRRSCRWSSG